MTALYRVDHVTRYAYASTVTASQHVAFLRPRELPYQHRRAHHLDIDPAPSGSVQRQDYFGNSAEHFQILTPHQHLAVSSSSVVEVQPRPGINYLESSPRVEEARRTWAERTPLPPAVAVFAYGSPHAPVIAPTLEFARPSLHNDQTVLGAALDLMHRIHETFTFDPSATSIATPVTSVIEQRRGVCQDFAHLHVAALRSAGIPARYVSGYLLTDPPPGQPRLIGADASHAWIAVYCPANGWIDLDPTNDVVVGLRHVTLAWGRDYGDVSPLRGVLMGGTTHSLTVGVSVIPYGDLEAIS